MKTNHLLNGVRHPLVPALWVAGAMLLGLSSTNQCRAGIPFPVQGDDTTSSEGVFRLVVDPTWRPMLGASGALPAYPGFHPADGRLTSPVLADADTEIGRSMPARISTIAFPVHVGAPALPPPGGWDTIAGYADYHGGIPPLFSPIFAGDRDLVLTEIKRFALETTGQSGCTNDRVPQMPLSLKLVKAGPNAPPDFPLARSLGMLEANSAVAGEDLNGTGARSFFDMFVEVWLPTVPGTASAPPSPTSFPPAGIYLTNGPSPDNPSGALIITNLSLNSVPPQVVYIHGGNTNAVDLYFATTYPGFWNAGDHFGKLTLAGHGTFTNDCAADDTLINTAFGPANNPKPEPPQAWPRPDSAFPVANAAYASVMADPNPPVSEDVIAFTIPNAGTAYLRNLSLNNLSQFIVPPLSGSAISANPNCALTGEISGDGHDYFPVAFTGQATLSISNAAPGTRTLYTAAAQQMDFISSSVFGPLWLKLNPATNSTGLHMISADARSCRVSSFFDVYFELNTDGLGYIPANRAIHLAPEAAAVPGSLFIQRTGTANTVLLSWYGPSVLQSASKVTGPFTDVAGAPSGTTANQFIYATGPSQQFFRLRQ